MRYDAFFSYSHSSHPNVVAATQSIMQRMGKQWWKRRALWIFRDDTSLSASPELWASIEEALSRSRYFVLFATPAAAESPWVGKEVEWWLQHRGTETILIALMEGDLEWDPDQRIFKAGETSACPQALCPAFAEEPKFVDLRGFAGMGKSALHKSSDFQSRVADLASTVHGTPKEDLLSEELRLQRRTVRVATGAAAVLGISLVVAVWQTIEARQQNARAERALTSISQSVGLIANDVAGSLRDRPDTPRPIVNQMLRHTEELVDGLIASGETRQDFMTTSVLALLELSHTRAELGDSARAIETSKKAVEVARNIVSQAPDLDDNRQLLSASLGHHAELLLRSQDYERAQAFIDESHRILEQIPGMQFSATSIFSLGHQLNLALLALDETKARRLAAQLERSFEQAETSQLDSIGAVNVTGPAILLASYYCEYGDAKKGLSRMAWVDARAQALRANRSSSMQARRTEAGYQNQLAKCFEADGQLEKALASSRRALELEEATAETADDPGASLNLGAVAHSHGRILMKLGRYPEALAAYEKAEKETRKLATADTGNVVFSINLALLLKDKASILGALGNSERAKSVSEDFVDLVRGLPASVRLDLATADIHYLLSALKVDRLNNINLARSIWKRYENDPAVGKRAHYWLEVSEPFARHHQFQHDAIESARNDDFAAAADFSAKRVEVARELDRQYYGKEQSDTAFALWSLGYFALRNGEFETALTSLEEARELLTYIEPTLILAIGNAWLASGDEEKAIEIYLERLEEFVERYGLDGSLQREMTWNGYIFADLDMLAKDGVITNDTATRLRERVKGAELKQ